MTIAYVTVLLLIESGLFENTLPGSGGQGFLPAMVTAPSLTGCQ